MKNILMKFTIFLFVLGVHLNGFSQILISDGGTQNICSGTFFDSGNSTGDYTNDEDHTISFCNSTPTECITIDFTMLDIENGYDYIEVHDGPTIASPLLYTLTGTSPIIVSSINSNCITLHFTSDGSVVRSGWEATISCGICPTCTDGIQNGTELGVDCGGSCAACPPPLNDEPCNATPVTVNPDQLCGSVTSGTTQSSTETTGVTNTCFGTADDDVWFSFVATNTAHIINLDNMTGTTDMYHAVYSGGCAPGSLTNLSCSDAEVSTIGGLVIGQTYYVQVYTYSSSGNNTGFDLCVGTPPPPPPNDEPCNATPVIVNPDQLCGIVTGSTTQSSSETIGVTTSCFGTADDDVWFSFVATEVFHSIDILNATGTTDMYHAVYSSGCTAGSLVNLSCSDANSSLVGGLLIGQTYYVQVYTWSSSGNNTGFDICVGTIVPTCSDGILNQDEVEIDCGGAICLACPTCTDGIQNGVELGIDCGGTCVDCPPTVQDCLGAIPICQDIYSETNAYLGTGVVLDEINSGPSCLGSGEKNDVWYTFTAQTTGSMCFSITPNNLSDDYDWAVYNLTNAICSDIYNNASLEVSCNYSGTSGVTGPNGLGGVQNESCLTVVQGETYVLNVSQFSTSTNGYTIDFGASVAEIFDVIPPEFDSVTINCDGNGITLYLSENVYCTGVIDNFSSFQLLDSNSNIVAITIDSVSSVNCNQGGEYDNLFTFYTTPQITNYGDYTFEFNEDPALITDICSNEAVSLSSDFSYDSLRTILTDTIVCLVPSVPTFSYALGYSGGNPPYSFYVNGVSNGTSNVFNNLAIPGDYVFEVYDIDNCVGSHPSIHVDYFDSIVFDYIETYCNTSDSITLHFSDQVACDTIVNYFTSFEVLDSNGNVMNGVISSISSLACSSGSIYDNVFTFYLNGNFVLGDNYFLNFTGSPNLLSSQDCGSASLVTDLISPFSPGSSPTVTLPNDTTLPCEDFLDIASVITNGVSPYNFLWNDGITTTQDVQIYVNQDSLLSLTVTDVCGTVTTESIQIIYNYIPMSLLIDIDNSALICPADSVYLTALVSDGAEPFIYLWSNNNSTLQSTALEITSDISTTVDITDFCANQISVTEQVLVPVIQPVVLQEIDSVYECFDREVNLTFDYVGGQAPYTYSWMSLSGQLLSSSETYDFILETQDTITGTVLEHCGDSDQILININHFDCELEIPNIITPNGDLKNDFFTLKMLEYFPNTQVTIYNRWGKKVYYSENYQNNWNGKHYKSENDLDEAVYFYVIVDFENNEHTGYLHLMR